jgi:hypothetical protein
MGSSKDVLCDVLEGFDNLKVFKLYNKKCKHIECANVLYGKKMNIIIDNIVKIVIINGTMCYKLRDNFILVIYKGRNKKINIDGIECDIIHNGMKYQLFKKISYILYDGIIVDEKNYIRGVFEN